MGELDRDWEVVRGATAGEGRAEFTPAGGWGHVSLTLAPEDGRPPLSLLPDCLDFYLLRNSWECVIGCETEKKVGLYFYKHVWPEKMLRLPSRMRREEEEGRSEGRNVVMARIHSAGASATRGFGKAHEFAT